MRAVAFRVGTGLRRRWRSAVGVAFVVAIVTGAVLTIAAGARRTATAVSRYTAATGGDYSGAVYQFSGPPRVQEVERLPDVAAVDWITFMVGAVLRPDGSSIDNAATFAGSGPFGRRVVAGRLPKVLAPDEFVASRSFVAATHAHVGERFRVLTWSRKSTARAPFSGRPDGATFGARLVGVVDSPSSIDDPTPFTEFSPEVLRGDTGIVTTIMMVRLRAGVPASHLRSALDALPNGRQLQVQSGTIVSDTVRNSVQAQATALVIIAVIVAFAAVAALGIILSRSVRHVAGDAGALRSLGYERRQQLAEVLGHAAVPAIAGIIVGGALAALLSGVFPTSFVRRVDPHPGMHPDWALLALMSLVFAIVLGLCVAASWFVARHPRATATRSLAETVAERTRSAPTATGIRFAFSRSGRDRGSALATLLGVALIVAGIVGATTFAVSVHRLVSDRSRYGENYDVPIDNNGSTLPPHAREVMTQDHDVAGAMVLDEEFVRRGSDTVPLVGMQSLRGGLAPPIIAGRAPVRRTEIALGRLTAHDIHARIGDTIRLDNGARHAQFRVVGLTVVPSFSSVDGVGVGAVTTFDGLLALAPDKTGSFGAVALRQDAPKTAAGRIIRAAGILGQGQESRPAAVENVARVQRIPALLAYVLAALVVVTLAYALVTALLARRRDIAILRTLGADRAWVRRAVTAHASVVAGFLAIVAVPLGLIVGRIVFRVFADRIGVIHDPATPVFAVAVVVIALLVFANLTLALTLRRARMVAPAALLRTE